MITNNKKQKAIRLVNVRLEKILQRGEVKPIVFQVYGVTCPFRLPEGMTLKDACRIVSYLTDKVEKENEFEIGDTKGTKLVSELLADYGFKALRGKKYNCMYSNQKYKILGKIKTICEKEPNTVDLFTVRGDMKVFDKTELKSRYFPWYAKGVTKEEVKAICNELGITITSRENNDRERS